MRRLALAAVLALAIGPVASAAALDDPLYEDQWGLAVIGAADAWKVTRGEGAIVAVIDSGVDLRHPDLRGRLLAGRDFVDDDDDPSDGNGHGTLVAGIVAAATSNGVGIASVAPQAKILPARVLNDEGGGSSPVVADAIRWAVERGADVINLSLAQEGADGAALLLPADLLRDPSVDRAIREAATAGATVVVAAGNDTDGGQAETSYDARGIEGVIVVGASTIDDRRAAYSNHGAGLDLLAPGGGSATDPGDAGCTRRNAVISLWFDPEERASAYGAGCGTSMAVPFVSGVAALLAARGLSSGEIVERILATARDMGEAGVDLDTGHGRLDAARALGATPVPAVVAKSGSPAIATAPGVVRAQGSPRAHPPRADRERRRRAEASRPPRADDRDGPVSAAAFLAATAVLAHGWRAAIVRARATRRAAR